MAQHSIPSKQAYIDAVAATATLAKGLDAAGQPEFAQQARVILGHLGHVAGDVAHGRPIVDQRAIGACGECIAGVVTGADGRLEWCPNGCDTTDRLIGGAA